ncbi:MAG: saccharopine dehydrogenase NADP-binding domain-containing protein [Candidatus Wallbacteria bacterium]|nr:saccharopine dehydrogenase NADP-binding domain-containing protein [Candidatus Wallbacteria bacterium]
MTNAENSGRTKKILVLGGAGAMGTEACRDLATTSGFEEIVIADIDLARVEKLAVSLGGGRVKPLKCDVTDHQAMVALMSGFGTVLNCTTYHFGLGLTRAAIEARAHYLDLGGLYNTPKQLELTASAAGAGVAIVLGCGATPGVTNLMARYGAERLDQVDAVHIAFASFRDLAPSPGLLDTILDEFGSETVRFYYEKGKFIEVPAFAGERSVEFKAPIGAQPTYLVPHSETHHLPRFLPRPPGRVDVRGTWRPEIMAALRTFHQAGLLSNEKLELPGGGEVGRRAFLRTHFLKTPFPAVNTDWAFLLNVEVAGTKDGRAVRRVYNTTHPATSAWGQSGTARVTGIPASIGAQLVAAGHYKGTGVLSPDAALDPVEFFAELAKREILVHEEVHEEARL